jgi:hypothetical protein
MFIAACCGITRTPPFCLYGSREDNHEPVAAIVRSALLTDGVGVRVRVRIMFRVTFTVRVRVRVRVMVPVLFEISLARGTMEKHARCSSQHARTFKLHLGLYEITTSC